MKYRFYQISLVALLILFFTNIWLGDIYRFNLRFWWFDVIYHFLGGFFVAMFFSVYLYPHTHKGLVSYNDRFNAHQSKALTLKGQFRTLSPETPSHLSFMGVGVYPVIKQSDQVLKRILIIVGATCLVGILWEFWEYILTYIFNSAVPKFFGVRSLMGDLEDTLSDLALDVLGALALSWVILDWKSKTQKIFKRSQI